MKCSNCSGILQDIKTLLPYHEGNICYFCPLCGMTYDKEYSKTDLKLVKISNPELLRK